MLAFANLGPPAVWYLRAAQMRVPQLICQCVALMALPTPTGVFANQPATCQVASEDSSLWLAASSLSAVYLHGRPSRPMRVACVRCACMDIVSGGGC